MLNIKNDNEKLNYVGNFGTFSKEGVAIKYSQNKGDYIELNFIGNKVRFYSHTNTWRGKANIYIDDIKVDTIDTYSQEEVMDVLVYESEELKYEEHKIKIEVLGEKREIAHEPKIAIYRFEVDEEKNNNLDLTELKAIVRELKALINE